MRILVVSLLGLVVACGGESDEGSGGSGGSSATGGSGATSGSGGSGTGASAGAGATGGNAGSGATGGGAGASGGSAGASGGSAGAGGAAPECTQASDCKMFEDCCSCEAVPTSANPPSCKKACTTERCGVLGATAKDVACVAGRCVMGFECDPKNVTCKIAIPQCASGQVPQVSGTCWTGECVPATECQSVAGCTDCSGKEQACVSFVAQLGPEHHCVDVPASCGAATCACLGATVCTGAFNACSEGTEGVSCGCPTC